MRDPLTLVPRKVPSFQLRLFLYLEELRDRNFLVAPALLSDGELEVRIRLALARLRAIDGRVDFHSNVEELTRKKVGSSKDISHMAIEGQQLTSKHTDRAGRCNQAYHRNLLDAGRSARPRQTPATRNRHTKRASLCQFHTGPKVRDAKKLSKFIPGSVQDPHL